MEFRGISLSDLYIRHKIYEQKRLNSSGLILKVGMALSATGGVGDLDSGDGDHWSKSDLRPGCIC